MAIIAGQTDVIQFVNEPIAIIIHAVVAWCDRYVEEANGDIDGLYLLGELKWPHGFRTCSLDFANLRKDIGYKCDPETEGHGDGKDTLIPWIEANRSNEPETCHRDNGKHTQCSSAQNGSWHYANQRRQLWEQAEKDKEALDKPPLVHADWEY